MASKINADEFVDREGEGKPTLPKGVVLSGVTTITTAVVADNEIANSTGINAGIITSTHFKGNLTGDVNAGIVTVTSQSVIGSGVTISASGVHVTGVISCTSYAGSGANLTGIGATIMTWEYNPEIDSTSALNSTGIGITFNQKIKAGSGNITIRSGGYDGTLVENFAIGSSVTIADNSLSFTPTSSLTNDAYYYVTLPSGVITNMAGENYVGTAYSFKVPLLTYTLWGWATNVDLAGQLTGSTSPGHAPSPTESAWGQQWVDVYGDLNLIGTKNDGTLWAWGKNNYGQLGHNSVQYFSSPVQIPGTNWKSQDGFATGLTMTAAIKTDGTLWAWGVNGNGQLGQGNKTSYSSPVQIPGTTWSSITAASANFLAFKTDGTMWGWGENEHGELGVNNRTEYESPVQIPGSWSTIIHRNSYTSGAIKTDGTLWMWGRNTDGSLGLNEGASDSYSRSSPTQVPGTTWSNGGIYGNFVTTVKTDGTLWAWGQNTYGQLGQNNRTTYSSPKQVPGSTWSTSVAAEGATLSIKTDGTLWGWGISAYAGHGPGNTHRSSPVQVGSDTDWHFVDGWGGDGVFALKGS